MFKSINVLILMYVRSGTVSKEASGKSFTMQCDTDKYIDVLEGTYGLNCLNADAKNNKIQHLKDSCNGKQSCTYKVDHGVIGDPAVGCQKEYDYKYECTDGMNMDMFSLFVIMFTQKRLYVCFR